MIPFDLVTQLLGCWAMGSESLREIRRSMEDCKHKRVLFEL